MRQRTTKRRPATSPAGRDGWVDLHADLVALVRAGHLCVAYTPPTRHGRCGGCGLPAARIPGGPAYCVTCTRLAPCTTTPAAPAGVAK